MCKIKNSFFVVVTLITFNAFSQIGINTTTPHAQLEVASSSLSSPTSIDGLLIPKVSVLNNAISGISSSQQGMMVYLTTTSGTNPPGFYYWDQTSTTWKPVGSFPGWSLTGNAGTNSGVNFIGTTDDEDIMFRRNGGYAGKLGYTSVALGFNALKNESPEGGNVAVGLNALWYNTTGESNTATGRSSLKFNTTASCNTANGVSALFHNETGANNTGLGYVALNANVSGNENTAVGYRSAMKSTDDYNTSLGSFSLFNLTEGSNNTALGYNAGYSLSSGSNNIVIGNNAQLTSTTVSNEIRMGNSSIANAYIQVAWNVTSDRRFKSDIKNSKLGLNFINKLNPVSYIRKNDETKRTEYGFIAQELEAALNDSGITNSGIISIDDKGMYSVRYNDFIPIAIKAIQEQQLIIEDEKAKNQKLQDKVDRMERRLLALEEKMTADSQLAENK